MPVPVFADTRQPPTRKVIYFAQQLACHGVPVSKAAPLRQRRRGTYYVRSQASQRPQHLRTGQGVYTSAACTRHSHSEWILLDT